MDCQEVADRIAPYLDRQLAPGELELFERHLESCEGCQGLVERIAEQDLSPPAVSEALVARMAAPGFWSRMDAALATELEGPGPAPVAAPRTPFSMALSWRGLVAYAALLLLAVGWGFHNQRQVSIARAEAESLVRQLEREQRIQDTPDGGALVAEDPNPEPLRARSSGSDDVQLAGYMPHRGTF